MAWIIRETPLDSRSVVSRCAWLDQYIGVQTAIVTERSLAEFPTVAKIVGGIRKTSLPVVAAMDYMLRNSGQIKTGQAGHVGSFMRT